MIISKVERLWTIVVAVLMLGAAGAYTYAVSGLGQEHLSFSDLCWIYSPTVLLTLYGGVLLLCYKQRGINVSTRFIQSNYQGSKYPWL